MRGDGFWVYSAFQAGISVSVRVVFHHHHQSSRVVIGYAASGDDDDTRHGLSLAFALRAEGPPGENCTFLRVLASHERG